MHVRVHLDKRLPFALIVLSKHVNQVIRHRIAALVPRVHYELLPSIHLLFGTFEQVTEEVFDLPRWDRQQPNRRQIASRQLLPHHPGV